MKILLLGSGALKIGEAGEFDYSGSQAIKTFKAAGHEVILINPNIATIQTDPEAFSGSEITADKIYFLPVKPSFVKQIILKEKPDALALSFGGQTALNCGLELEACGFLDEQNVEVLGTSVETIRKTEDREVFKQEILSIGVKTPRSFGTYNLKEAKEAAQKIGFPLIMRAGFALGGKGSGFCEKEEDFEQMAKDSFAFSPQLLIEEDLRGWKEVEYEMVRDHADNCIAVVNMENFDPLGIHTGESIVVSPSMTLANKEYQILRSVGQKVVRHLGMVGEGNIQFALNPADDEDYRVIEVNARLSRSSALASKATGYPLAAVAAQIMLKKTLPEIKNAITQTTTAFFEPALDYIAVKIPRWDLQKFRKVSQQISTEMKSVGEVMALGRTFPETIQKAVRMLQIGANGVLGPVPVDMNTKEECENHLKYASAYRLFAVAISLFNNFETVESLYEKTKIDRWFLTQMKRITDHATLMQSEFNDDILKEAKKLGFADVTIEKLSGKTVNRDDLAPVTKQIDTLAAEFPAQTNYLYTTYHGVVNDV